MIHFDFVADEPERAIAFYQKAFGWTIERGDRPKVYWLITTGLASEPGIDGGFGRRNEPGWGAKPGIGVDLGDACLEKVAANGGRMIQPKSAVPGVGWLADCQDRQGNRFSLMQNDQAAR